MKNRIKLYLDRYADRDIPTDLPAEICHQAVVIPVLAENRELPHCLLHLERAAAHAKIHATAILIVNSDAATPIAWQQQNHALLTQYSPTAQHAATPHSFNKASAHFSIFLVDRNSPLRQFPLKSGVGKARKHGADIALNWLHSGKLTSPWIHTTDADARVPLDYFQAPFQPGAVAAIHPYSHLHSDCPADLPIALYEIFLRYYETGLRFAHSPFAFPTIGSLICFNAEAYATVRGFPIREAGEDFYFLNKMRKLGPVQQLTGNPITLAVRREVRVPFGTTKSQLFIEQSLASDQPFGLYDPKVFIELQLLLREIMQFTAHRSPLRFEQSLSPSSRHAWNELHGTAALTSALSQRKNCDALGRHLVDWFDGFRTLKFIHSLTAHNLPKLPWEKAVRLAPFMPQDFTSAFELVTSLRRLQ